MGTVIVGTGAAGESGEDGMESGMVEISEGGGEPEGVEETGEVEGAGETGEVEEIEGAGDSEEPEEFEPDASAVEYPDCSSARA